MLLDTLEHASLYRPLHPGIAAAMHFLAHTDLTSLPDGRTDIQSDRLFAIAQRYAPKPGPATVWESHRRYIDVQYVAAGVERMGWTLLSPALKITQPYDEAKDVTFYDVAGDQITVAAGSFVVFHPHDVHAPGLAGPRGGEVFKVVVKVAVNW
ncbi:MAG: YhcH/YjgK/YiaL family protein [Phycisphaeraceae bacterium]|nr:YhcH/YjgK/YiaL family protein [Phycisphaeraceae bacterium]